MNVLKISVLVLSFSILWSACQKTSCSCLEPANLTFDIVEENGDKLQEVPELIPLVFDDSEPVIQKAHKELFFVFAESGSTFVLKYDSLRQDTFKVDFITKPTKCCPDVQELEIRRNGELICEPCEDSDEHRIVLE